MAEWAKIIKTNIMEATLTSFYANEWWTFPNSFSGYSFTNTKTRQRHYKKENYNPTSLTNLDEDKIHQYIGKIMHYNQVGFILGMQYGQMNQWTHHINKRIDKNHMIISKWKVRVLVTQSCPTLCDPMNCSPPGSSVHGILQARILKWVAVPFSRGSSWPRDRNWVSYTAGRFFTLWIMIISKDLEKAFDKIQHPFMT